MLCFPRANKFRKISTTIFLFSENLINFGKIFVLFCLWSGPLAKNLQRYLEIQFAVKSRQVCKDEYEFAFLLQENT